ncbi:MAG TPA: MFS transporter [Dehalococcoidia bacterium]|nr:MFS transporter [Chloroflexota bacterium]HIB11450.1 MFS transporter [Dehalococcoidia bacterium]
MESNAPELNTSAVRGLNRILPSSMRYGHFRFYWLGLLAGVTGHQMLLSFTLGWLMFQLTGEERDLAFLGIAIAVPAMTLNVVGGTLADRLEPKFLVAMAQSISATVVVGLAMLVMTERVEVWHLLAAAVAIGALQAFDQPSRAAVFPRLVEREHIVSAVTMSELVWNGVRVLGPTLAGILIEQLSIEASMLFSAGTFYIMGTVTAFLRLRPRPPATGRVLQQALEGLRYVRKHEIFSLIMLLTFCNSMFGMTFVHLMPSFAKEVLGVGADKIGILLGASGAGAILGTITVANLRGRHPKGLAILGGAMAYGLALLLFAAAASQGWYLTSMGMLFIVGITNSIYLVGGMSTIQHLVPDRLRGRVMGVYAITWSLGPFGMVQGGFIAQYFGAPVAVAVGATLIILVAISIFLFSSRLRGLRAEMPAELQLAYAE